MTKKFQVGDTVRISKRFKRIYRGRQTTTVEALRITDLRYPDGPMTVWLSRPLSGWCTWSESDLVLVKRAKSSEK